MIYVVMVAYFIYILYTLHRTISSVASIRIISTSLFLCVRVVFQQLALCKKASNHHANLPLEMYSFTL